MTAKAVIEALVREKGYMTKELPAESTMRELLGKMGYRLRRVQKTKPQKKIPETDAIFANVKAAHAKSDKDDKTLRISIDKIKLGEFSRGGKLRCFDPVKASDHDMEVHGILIPFGILEVKQKQFNVVYGNSLETMRQEEILIVDGLEWWWRYRKKHDPHIERLQIDLDNGRSWRVAERSSSNVSSIGRTRSNCRWSWCTIRRITASTIRSNIAGVSWNPTGVGRCWRTGKRFVSGRKQCDGLVLPQRFTLWIANTIAESNSAHKR